MEWSLAKLVIQPAQLLSKYKNLMYDVSLVKFSIAGGGVSTGEIFQGTPLDVEFTNTPNCAESSKWKVFVDNDIQNMYVGIGGLKDHPGQEPGLIGTFSIVRNKLANKFLCTVRRF